MQAVGDCVVSVWGVYCFDQRKLNLTRGGLAESFFTTTHLNKLIANAIANQ